MYKRDEVEEDEKDLNILRYNKMKKKEKKKWNENRSL